MNHLAPNNVIEMMSACAREIKQLRAERDRLVPKAEAYDLLSAIISRVLPQQSRGAGVDLVWQLEKAVEEIKQEHGGKNEEDVH